MTETLKRYLFVGETKDDGIIPYLSNESFPGLEKEAHTFINGAGLKVGYFFYSYESCRRDKIVLFLHGVGAGHKAYLREIETLCSRGYRVLTLDYSGCGESEGEHLPSLFEPAKDVTRLLGKLNLAEEIVLVGHSLGGFTALLVASLCEKIKKAVVISGSFSLEWHTRSFKNSEEICDYEKRSSPGLCDVKLEEYLRKTDDKILFIHSEDDPVIPFDISTGYIMENIKNLNFSFHTEKNRGHNPNYSDAAIKYMREVFSEYTSLVSSGALDTYEKKKAYMADKSPLEMTHQDSAVFDEIVSFID